MSSGRSPRRHAQHRPPVALGLSVAWLAALAAAARAETPAWYPDRPNLTVSPQVLPMGTFGFDMGLSYTGDTPGRDELLSVPIKLRLPLSPRWELQLGWEAFDWSDRPQEPGRIGTGDLFAASRTIVDDGEGLLPVLAIEAGATIPAASRPAFGVGKPSFYALLAAEFTPYDNVWLDLNVGIELSGIAGRSRSFVADEFATGALGLSVARVFEPYVEVRWEATHGDGAGDLTVLDIGMVSYVGERLALDASIATGLSEAAPDLLLVIGFSVLFGPE